MPLYGVALIEKLTLSGELNTGIKSMNKTARKSFDLISFSSNYGLARQTGLAGLSLGIVTKQALFDYGSKLVDLADSIYFHKQSDALHRISKALIDFPLPQFEKIGLYYKALCLKKEGRTEESNALFEKVIEKGPASYRARAIQSYGAAYFDNGDYDSAHQLFIEARHLSCRSEYSNPLAFLQSQWGLAVTQSIRGDHNSSSANLENLRPMVDMVASRHPSIWFDYQNSLAVEFMEIGRIEEAEQASRIAIASPYARLYPEWHETARDLEKKTRRASSSVVSLSKCDLASQSISKSLSSERPETRPVAVSDNLFRLHTETRSEPSSRRAQSPARILAFRDRTNTISNEDILNDPVYLEKRYQIMVTAAESMDLQLLDEMYTSIIRRRFSGNNNPSGDQ